MDYKLLLEHSLKTSNEFLGNLDDNRLQFLSKGIFDFTTYDSAMDELFAKKAVEVCSAILNRTTFEYIGKNLDSPDYQWYLLMCNMPFFYPRLSWGTSIRGAWWDLPTHKKEIVLESCDLYEGDKQLLTLKFTLLEWKEFIKAVIEFANTKETKDEDPIKHSSPARY